MIKNIAYEHFWDPRSKLSVYLEKIGKEIDTVFFDGSAEFEPPPVTRQLFKNDILDKANKVIWITGGYDLSDFIGMTIPSNFDIYFWPTFFFTHTVSKLETFKTFKNYPDTIKNVEEVQYKFISYNRKGHNHRCVFIDQLAKHSLIEDNLVSWQTPEVEFNFKHFIPKLLVIDEPKGYSGPNADNHAIPSVHFKAFANIIAESVSSDPIFITEKTVKALITGDLFLVLGARNFHQKLKDIGFKLYTEVFDYSFDSKDTPTRVKGIIDNLLNLPNDFDELTRLKKSLHEKRMYNHNLALQIARECKYIEPRTLELLKDYSFIFPKGNATDTSLDYLKKWNPNAFLRELI